MMATSSTKPYGASIIHKAFQQPISPSRKFSSSSIAANYSAYASSMPSFSSPTKSSSPNLTNYARWGPPRASVNRRCVSPPPSVRFSIDHRKASPDRTVASPLSREKNQSGHHVNSNKPLINGPKNCMYSATKDHGSLPLHNNLSAKNRMNSNRELYQSYRLYLPRSAMKNSIVRNGTVDDDLDQKRALASLVRRLPQQKIRRSDFQSRPSRLSVMSR